MKKLVIISLVVFFVVIASTVLGYLYITNSRIVPSPMRDNEFTAYIHLTILRGNRIGVSVLVNDFVSDYFWFDEVGLTSLNDYLIDFNSIFPQSTNFIRNNKARFYYEVEVPILNNQNNAILNEEYGIILLRHILPKLNSPFDVSTPFDNFIKERFPIALGISHYNNLPQSFIVHGTDLFTNYTKMSYLKYQDIFENGFLAYGFFDYHTHEYSITENGTETFEFNFIYGPSTKAEENFTVMEDRFIASIESMGVPQSSKVSIVYLGNATQISNLISLPNYLISNSRDVILENIPEFWN